jgi:hypothetical protein
MELASCFYITENQENSIQFFIYLRAELKSQWPITGSARIHTAIRQHRTELKQKGQQNKHKK